MKNMNDISFINQNMIDNYGSVVDLNQYLFLLVISLFFGVILNVLYNIYFRESEPSDASLSRSLVLLTPSLMTIFWIVQHSLSLSVGLLGALSFVRFRSPVKRAEDIAFIVISLTCSITCAISNPLIGAILVLLFLTFAVIRNSIIPRFILGKNFAVLTYNTKKLESVKSVESIMESANIKKYEFVSSRKYDGIVSYVYNISNLDKNNFQILFDKLGTKDSESNINVFFPNGRIS